MLGITRFLRKPIEIAELLQLFADYCGAVPPAVCPPEETPQLQSVLTAHAIPRNLTVARRLMAESLNNHGTATFGPRPPGRGLAAHAAVPTCGNATRSSSSGRSCSAIAWFWGTGPGVLATVLSGPVTFAQLPPSGFLYVENTDDAIMVGLFALVGLVAPGSADAAGGPTRAAGRVRNGSPWSPTPRRCSSGWRARTSSAPTSTSPGSTSQAARSTASWARRGSQSVHPEDLPRGFETYLTAFDARASHSRCEYRLRRADGDYRHMLDRGTPLQSATAA